MPQGSNQERSIITPWHRNLLVTAAIFTVFLVAMGGVLCATQSIRRCPDWPGCFGRILPPLEISPILEITHRFLAGISGLLLLAAAIAGLMRTRQLLWVMLPPVLTIPLVLAVSYFGAMVVLHGISPGWAAVDLGSALLVVFLIVTAAVFADAFQRDPHLPHHIKLSTPYTRLVLFTLIVVYGILVTGVLVAGQNSYSGCLGWPIYATTLDQIRQLDTGNLLRQSLSLIGILLIMMVLVQAGRNHRHHPGIFSNAVWVGCLFLLEMLLQVLIRVFNFNVFLLVAYSVTMSIFWGVMVVLAINVVLENGR